MKKKIYFLVFFVMIMFAFSFTNKSRNSILNSNLKSTKNIVLPSQTSWGPWQKLGCFRGLSFRTKRGSYNKYAKKYKWNIQFKNLYKQDIHFNFIGIEPSRAREIKRTGATKHRGTARANGGTKDTWFLVNNSSNIYVYVNRVRIGKKDVGPYSNCD